MKVVVQESARKDLKKIDKSEAKKMLEQLKLLQDFPNLSNIKKLKNHYPPFRLRIGRYRVLFDIEKDTLIVIHILHRKDAYD